MAEAITGPARLDADRRLQHAERLTVAWVLALAAVAWLATAFLHGIDSASLTSGPDGNHYGVHAGHGAGLTGSSMSVVGLRVSGWLLMVVAMMVPPALPLLRVVRRLGSDRRDGQLLVGAALVAFTTVWGLAGLAYVVLDVLGRATAGLSPWVSQHPQVLAGTAVAAAGIWQFTPAKQACLTACRSPVGMAMVRWNGQRPVRDVLRIGAGYAAVCVGCCWALMALTLVVGLAALPFMVVMSVIMATERTVPRVRPFVPFVGVIAIMLGIAIAGGLMPSAWSPS